MNVDIVIVVASILLFFGFVMLVRNELVYRARIRGIDFISKQKDWMKLQDMYLGISGYDKLMLSFNKWTYAQMFPELYKLEQELSDER